MLDKARKHALRCSFEHAKDKWDKLYATLHSKIGDLVLVSTTNFYNIKGCKKENIKALHGENTVEVELSEEPSSMHTKFPVSLIKPYTPCDSE
ncbi:hypothetical protein O181_019807 [Austropuccinia psidii MF-1]|uniref:Uncharacterized protein n=1 Tax=Austropuccinia psidii MF-1 TaxID=1389203 RepID=A0A9Q3CCB1_9BASI|nr:hypothetical protein [Austropuccinia psidii MF-1]